MNVSACDHPRRRIHSARDVHSGIRRRPDVNQAPESALVYESKPELPVQRIRGAGISARGAQCPPVGYRGDRSSAQEPEENGADEPSQTEVAVVPTIFDGHRSKRNGVTRWARTATVCYRALSAGNSRQMSAARPPLVEDGRASMRRAASTAAAACDQEASSHIGRRPAAAK